MNDKNIEKFAWVSIIVIGLFIIGMVLLLGWSIIEIVNWLTSK